MSRSTPPRLLVALLGAALPSDRDGRARLGDYLEEHTELAARRGRLIAHGWLAGHTSMAMLQRLVRTGGDLGGDFRFAMRGIRRRPVLSTVVIGTLGLGVGAGTAVFAVVDSLLFRPLPFEEPQELVRVWAAERGGDQHLDLMYGDLPDLFAASTLQSVAGFSIVRRTLLDDDRDNPETVTVVRTLGDLGSLLGIGTMAGRLPSVQELATGAPVAVVSEGLWRRRFGGDPSAIGRLLQLEGGPLEIIGVVPVNHLYPEQGDVWRPTDPDGEQDDDRELHVVGRLAEDIALETAAVEVSAIGLRQAERWPESHGAVSTWIQPLQLTLVGDVRTTLLAFLGSVGVLLAIICLNTAYLLLARARDRAHATAVRISMGITRSRILRMHLVESLTLGLLAGGLGVMAGRIVLDGVLRVAPGLPMLHSVGMDLRVMAVGVGCAVICGLAFGAAPAVRAATQDPLIALKAGGRGGDGRGGRRFGSALVATEVALSTTLVVLAFALTATFQNVLRYDRGFEADGLIALDIEVGHAVDGDADAEPREYYARLLESVRRLPTVTGAGLTSHPVTEQRGLLVDLTVDGEAPPAGGGEQATTRIISDGFFGAARIEMTQGRDFSDDWTHAAGEIVVNENFVRTFLRDGGSALGRRVRTDWAEGRIVGVVADVSPAVDEPARPIVYLHLAQVPLGGSLLMVRSGSERGAVAPDVWRAIREIDPSVVPSETEVLATSIRGSVAAERFNMAVVGSFAALAILLAALGIFGMTASAVAARHREIGIRRALGASTRRILRQVSADTGRTVAMGAGAGVVGAVMAERVVASMFVGARPSDPFLVTGVVVVLAAVTVVATLIPMRRAARVEPTEALKS